MPVLQFQSMTRYKGSAKTKLIERDFPQRVEMLIPEGGLGKRLDEMHDWHHARGIQAKFGRSWRDKDNRDHLTWCFADPATAESFASEFK